MSSELINRISIKKDGVYVSTHSNNDTSPYHSVRFDFLSKAYAENGQRGLDKAIVDICFYNCQLRGNHKSILPYKEAIEKAIYDEEFTKIRNEYDKLDDKAFDIANRFGEYKNLSKEESEKMYKELEPELKRLRNRRNEFVADIVKKERKKIIGPKELKDGIYEIISPHNTHKKLSEIWYEYMNFNSNNGTIIYSLNLSSLMPADKPDIIKIGDYMNMINKYGVDNIGGAKEFKKFIEKYPDIYIEGIKNEHRDLEKEISEENESQLEEMEDVM